MREWRQEKKATSMFLLWLWRGGSDKDTCDDRSEVIATDRMTGEASRGGWSMLTG